MSRDDRGSPIRWRATLRPVAWVVLLGVAVVAAVDPHPFDRPTDAPVLAVAAQPSIDGATALALPEALLAPTWDPERVSEPAGPNGSDAAATIPPAPEPAAAIATATVVPVPVPPAPPPAPPIPSTTTASPPPPAVSAAFAPNAAPSTVTVVAVPVIAVYANEADPQPATLLSATTEFGSPRVFLTTRLRGDWIEVVSLDRPNGARVWVRARDVTLQTVDDRVEVDLTARTLTWSRSGAVLLQTAVGVGSPATPTPTGTFFVTDVLAWNPLDGRGAWIVALNGHSDAYATFEGGDARIAIHGTDDASSIGGAQSNGCMRLAPGPLDQLRAGVALGTPVVVTRT